MTEQQKNPYAERGDRNLSGILGRIRDDGPAGVDDAARVASGVARTAAASVADFGASPPGPGPARSVGTPSTFLARSQPSRWRRASTVAALLVVTSLLALVFGYLGSRVEFPGTRSSASTGAEDRGLGSEDIRSSLESLANRVDRLADENAGAVLGLKQRILDVATSGEQGLAVVEQRMQRLTGMDARLALLAVRVEQLADQVGKHLARMEETSRTREDAEALATESEAEIGGGTQIYLSADGPQPASSQNDDELSTRKPSVQGSDENADATVPPTGAPKTPVAHVVAHPSPDSMDQNQTPRETGSELASHPTNVLHALAGPGLLRDSPPVQEAISVTRTAKARPHAATHSTDEFRLDDASGHADTDAEGARGQGLSATPEPAVEPLVAPEAPDAAEPLVEIKSEGSMRAGSESAGTLVGVRTERRPATAEQWAINLIALSNEAKAQQLLRTYAAKGVDAELVEMRRSRAGSTLFGLRIPGFATRREAVARSTDVKQKLGIKEVWIYQYANR